MSNARVIVVQTLQIADQLEVQMGRPIAVSRSIANLGNFGPGGNGLVSLQSVQ